MSEHIEQGKDEVEEPEVLERLELDMRMMCERKLKPEDMARRMYNAGYRKLSPLNKHDLIQFLTGCGINQADKLSRDICGRFGFNDDKYKGPNLAFEMCYDDNKYAINKAVENAIQKYAMGWENNRQRLNFYEEIENHLKKNMKIRSSPGDQSKLVEALKDLLDNLPWGIDDCSRITVFHPSGGSGTMGPNMIQKLKTSKKKAEQALSEHGEG